MTGEANSIEKPQHPTADRISYIRDQISPTWKETAEDFSGMEKSSKGYWGAKKKAARRNFQTEQEGFKDHLTGLLNRKGLMERFNGVIESSKRNNQFVSIGLIFLDLDNFKALNDTLGHPRGDVYLKHLADLLNKHFDRKKGEKGLVRPVDIVSRPGGDEFVMVFPDIKEGIQLVAERLRKAIADDPEGNKYWKEKITASIGATVVSPGRNDDTVEIMDRMLQEADIALYNAKAAGRDTFRIYQPGMQIPSKEHGRFRTPPQS